MDIAIDDPSIVLRGRKRLRSPAKEDNPSISTPTNSHEMSQNYESEALLCFGSLPELKVQVRSDPMESQCQLADTITLELVSRDDTLWIKHGDGTPFGYLPTKISRGMRRLCKLPFSCIEAQGIAALSDLEQARASWKSLGRSATLTIDINIYGHPHCAKIVGDELTSGKLFLQPPKVDLRYLVYDNPQQLRLNGLNPTEQAFDAIESVDKSVLEKEKEVSQSGIEAIFDHLPQLVFLQEVSVDNRIIADLLKHQKQAIDFMNRRETGNLPPSLSLWTRIDFSCYQNVITYTKNMGRDDPLGGILGDDMGLGKTITTLAVIVGSLGRALEFAMAKTKAAPSTWYSLVPSKTTLVIVPSSLLLDSWAEEIRKHILPGTIRLCRYHGSGKRVGLTDLLSCDIVITTYATVAAEFCRGQSMISRVEWYRLVLDEGDDWPIFLSDLGLRAIHSICAHIRWCLTGTPIQNSLEDLGALVNFLRVPILDDMKMFRKYITNPILSNKSGRFANLRRILEAICLRRTRRLLLLPDPIIYTQILELSSSESKTYHDFGESCRRAIDLAVSGRSLKKANHHIIQAMLGMRLFCNVGQRAFTGKWNSQNLPSDPEEALSCLQICGESSCIQCECEIQSMYQAEDRTSGLLTICQHLLCGECLPVFEADLDNNSEGGRTICPICGQHGARESFIVKPSQNVDTTFGPAYPTKLLALLTDVSSQSPTDKCVIFSFWKKTLDLVAELFQVNGISFLRIHGSIPSGRRARILTEFEQPNSARVLLITFSTGGVGINKLMVANHIHILEPQWNPSVESQAIGRILRLGQERYVKIIRYIMKNTVEESVQSQQLRKLQLARGGFGLTKDEHDSHRIQEIMELLCPSASFGQLVD